MAITFFALFQGYCPLGKGKLLDKKVIVDIAKKYNKTAAQILIRWSVENNVITIPKSTKIERVYENSQASEVITQKPHFWQATSSWWTQLAFVL